MTACRLIHTHTTGCRLLIRRISSAASSAVLGMDESALEMDRWQQARASDRDKPDKRRERLPYFHGLRRRWWE